VKEISFVTLLEGESFDRSFLFVAFFHTSLAFPFPLYPLSPSLHFSRSDKWTHDLEWSGAEGFRSAERLPWYRNDGFTEAGTYKTFGNFTMMFTHESGHFLPKGEFASRRSFKFWKAFCTSCFRSWLETFPFLQTNLR